MISRVQDLRTNNTPLDLCEVPVPTPREKEILVKVVCCGICHTELDEIEGRITPAFFPIIPGHQVIGTVSALGPGATRFRAGARVGVGWIFSACGNCVHCLSGFENLCTQFKGCGRDAHGGYAEYMLVNENYAFSVPDALEDETAAPLLCAGAIGYRSLQLAGVRDSENVGLTGFGSSGHLVLKMIRHLYPSSRVAVFAREEKERTFAASLGAEWTGDISGTPRFPLKAIIDTTPAWRPILESLSHLAPGGRLVINAIRKDDLDKPMLLDLVYEDHLWMEKEIKTVANITRRDISDFLALAASARITPHVELYKFEDANRAILDLKQKAIRGAKVLRVNGK